LQWSRDVRFSPNSDQIAAAHSPRSADNLQTRDEAFLIAVNIAKLPSATRQIMKDIPRSPNTASRDD
jgi:hypothetical protein